VRLGEVNRRWGEEKKSRKKKGPSPEEKENFPLIAVLEKKRKRRGGGYEFSVVPKKKGGKTVHRGGGGNTSAMIWSRKGEGREGPPSCSMSKEGGEEKKGRMSFFSLRWRLKKERNPLRERMGGKRKKRETPYSGGI